MADQLSSVPEKAPRFRDRRRVVSWTALGGIALILGASLSPLTTTSDGAANAAAGTPGVPQAPVVLFKEDFENRDLTENQDLTDYVGAVNTKYTADPYWRNTVYCNGLILNRASERRTADGDVDGVADGDCTQQNKQPGINIAYDGLASLPYVLGLHAGLTEADAENNSAAAAFTEAAAPATESIQFQTLTPLTLPASNRFITFSVDAAATTCWSAKPLLRFYLTDTNGPHPISAKAINPCTDNRATLYEIEGLVRPEVHVYAGRFAADSSMLMLGNTLGIILRNESTARGGNDGAYDNIRVLDATPQLDLAFSPSAAIANKTTTLTYTITNTDDLASKQGWSFTSSFPAGLVTASTPHTTTSCTNGSITATPGSGTVEVSGDLDSGQASCTFSVDVTSATPTGSQDSPVSYQICAADITNTVGINPPACATVQFHSSRLLEVTKTTAMNGNTANYTVEITNVGEGDFTTTNPATVTDDLERVLDDAIYNNDGTASAGPTPVYSAPRLSWTGPLVVGASVTLSYSVTLKPDDQRGDNTLVNQACVPESLADDPTEACATTTRLLPALTHSISVDPVSTTLVPNGKIVSYTLTFANTGKATTSVNHVNDLSGVLDDAAIVTAPLASSSALILGAVTNGRFTITGNLEPGQTVTIRYTVKVNDDASPDKSVLTNFLLGSSDTTPTACSPTNPDCTLNPVGTPPASLAFTGTDATILGLLGALMLLIGLGTHFVARHRKATHNR